MHPRVVMETLGHSQIGITLDTYSHVLPVLQRDAADEMDKALGACFWPLGYQLGYQTTVTGLCRVRVRRVYLGKMARPAGFEPATLGLEVTPRSVRACP